jgi:hypothetical protein
LASQRTAISQEVEQFSVGKIILSTDVNTNIFNIVTGAKASQFKSMRYRNCCKFSCTSGSVCPRAWGGRARPRDPGDEDDIGREFLLW